MSRRSRTASNPRMDIRTDIHAPAAACGPDFDVERLARWCCFRDRLLLNDAIVIGLDVYGRTAATIAA